MKKELLRMSHVTLIENNDLLLDNITFHIYAGEILGLVAKEDKGADKLINLICNNSRIDFGSVWFCGRIVNRYSYSDNTTNKVYLIEKKSHLVEALSIVDNIFVMRKGFRKYFINERVLEKQVEIYLRENNIEIDMYKKVSELSDIDRCKIELIKFELLETQYGEGDAAKSQTIAENYITQGVVGIFGCNEGSTTGTGNAIKASSKTDIVGVGFDKSDAIMNLITDGYLLCTMAQNPDVMGMEGVKAAVLSLEGADYAGKVTDTGVSVIRK